MSQTKILKSNQCQVVRLPNTVAFPENVEVVEIIVVGNTRVITPINKSWDSWFENPSVTEEIMPDREQPKLQERESL